MAKVRIKSNDIRNDHAYPPYINKKREKSVGKALKLLMNNKKKFLPRCLPNLTNLLFSQHKFYSRHDII